MEKHIPHCKLPRLQALVGSGHVRATQTALAGAAALEMDYSAMLEIVMSLKPCDFYKSMTTHGNHRIWQDVYRHRCARGDVYLKLTVIDDVLIVSFKEL